MPRTPEMRNFHLVRCRWAQKKLQCPAARSSPETISIKYQNSKFRIPIAALGNDDGKSKEKKKSKSIRLQAKRDACQEEARRSWKNAGSWSPKKYIFMISNFC